MVDAMGAAPIAGSTADGQWLDHVVKTLSISIPEVECVIGATPGPRDTRDAERSREAPGRSRLAISHVPQENPLSSKAF